MLWDSHPNIIAFSKPNNEKYDNQLLIWKVLSFLCTLSRLHLLCPNCPSVSLAQHHPNLHITLSHLEAFSHFFFTLENPKSLISVQKPKSKTPRRCQNTSSGSSKNHGSSRESGKKQNEARVERVGTQKIETLTSKCVLDLQIHVQDSSISKK